MLVKDTTGENSSITMQQYFDISNLDAQYFENNKTLEIKIFLTEMEDILPYQRFLEGISFIKPKVKVKIENNLTAD